MAKETLDALSEKDDDVEHRRDFLESVLILSKAVCNLAARYALLAEEKAVDADGARKKELLGLAVHDRSHL